MTKIDSNFLLNKIELNIEKKKIFIFFIFKYEEVEMLNLRHVQLI